jgi:hypothetical protein
MTTKTQDRITLKNIKHCAFASEETYCYEASVYFDNKRVGTVKNDGHGGADYWRPSDEKGWKAMQAYISTLDGEVFYNTYIAPSLEQICCEIVTDYLNSKDLKRALSKKVLFQKNGNAAVFETKAAPNKATLEHWVNLISERPDTSAVLNRIPFESALKIYLAT